MSGVECDNCSAGYSNTASESMRKQEHSSCWGTNVLSLFCAIHSHLLIHRRQSVRITACAAGLRLRTTILGKADGKSHLSRGKGGKKGGAEQLQTE